MLSCGPGIVWTEERMDSISEVVSDEEERVRRSNKKPHASNSFYYCWSYQMATISNWSCLARYASALLQASSKTSYFIATNFFGTPNKIRIRIKLEQAEVRLNKRWFQELFQQFKILLILKESWESKKVLTYTDNHLPRYFFCFTLGDRFTMVEIGLRQLTFQHLKNSSC